MKPNITYERLRELLDYSSETGLFTWKVDRRRARAGAVAGRRHPNGYTYITVDYQHYRAHRLAWLWVFGVWPNGDIDHINRERSDNRISNLRSVTKSENQQNRSINSNNKSGFMGVSWHGKSLRWQAHIRTNGKSRNLGTYLTPEAASAAYIAAKKQQAPFLEKQDVL